MELILFIFIKIISELLEVRSNVCINIYVLVNLRRVFCLKTHEQNQLEAAN